MITCTRNQLLGLIDRRFGHLEVGGLHFRFRNLTEDEKSEFEAAVLSSDGKYSLAKIRRQRRKLLRLCLVGDDNQPLLKPEDEDSLRAIDGVVTSRLYDAIREHCGFDEGDLGELVKNSERIQENDSLTD